MGNHPTSNCRPRCSPSNGCGGLTSQPGAQLMRHPGWGSRTFLDTLCHGKKGEMLPSASLGRHHHSSSKGGGFAGGERLFLLLGGERVFQIPESMVVLSSRNFSNHCPAEASANHPAGHDSRRDLVGGEGHTFFPWLSALMGEHAQTSSPVCGKQRAGNTAGRVSPRGSSRAWFPGSAQRGWALGGALEAGTGPCFPDLSSYFL